ncbi:MAG: FliA/WhiG family RNA polymerase sigma factor [Sedimentisphaerales bacterium]|nr:FliA/WhiG family RNA polymerase sigma factor [Sedimentisphaerales bacterium]
MDKQERQERQKAMMKIWEQFKANSTEQLRNVLVESYLHLVKYNADRIYAKLPDEVELDDLISAGVFGLMDAIDAFDLSRGVKFETYCAPRIRGAILDELRAMDWVPRLVRSRSHQLQEVSKSLEAQFGRAASDEEIARKMGISDNDFIKLKRDATAVSLISLSRKWFETDSQKEVCEIDVLEDKRGENPFLEIQRRDLKESLIKGLSRAEKLILILYYYEEMTMKEIGATLDLSESRVSQMHSSILARLKAQMSHNRKEVSPV